MSFSTNGYLLQYKIILEVFQTGKLPSISMMPPFSRVPLLAFKTFQNFLENTLPRNRSFCSSFSTSTTCLKLENVSVQFFDQIWSFLKRRHLAFNDNATTFGQCGQISRVITFWATFWRKRQQTFWPKSSEYLNQDKIIIIVRIAAKYTCKVSTKNILLPSITFSCYFYQGDFWTIFE